MGRAKRQLRAGPAAAASTTPAPAPDDGSSAQVPAMGLPGEPGHMVVVNQFSDPHDPRNQGGPSGIAGLYRAVLTLQRAGRPLTPEYAASFEGGLRGDSHLAITKPAYSPPIDATQIRGQVIVDGAPYEWHGHPNERGFLGKVALQPFHASGFRDAEQRAYRAVASSLSNWSAHLDIPLQVAQIDVTESRTGNTQVSLMNPRRRRPPAGHGVAREGHGGLHPCPDHGGRSLL